MPKDTILFVVRGMSLKTEFRVGIAVRPVAFGQDCKAIVAHEGIDPLFLAYVLASRQYEVMGLVDEASHGTGRLQTYLIGNLAVPLPPLPEQRKIAEILSTWDEAIATVDALLAALRRRKQGLMQRLLTGQVRFGEFANSNDMQVTRFGEIPAEWGYLPMGEVAREVSIRNSNGGDLTVLSCTKYDGLVDSLAYFGRQIYSDDTSTYKVVKRGQFAYATNHIEEGSIGYQELYDEALISPMYTVFQTDNRIHDAYLYRILKTELYRHIFEISTSGTVDRRGSLRWNDFSRIRVPVPSLAEQQKIADLFDKVDAEIKSTVEVSNSLKQQKKGLMQRLLTGQVRVGMEGESQ
jgi:type I restriction enzyme S subunit